MTRNLKAIYEQGVLRLNEPLPLAEGTGVDVTVSLREEGDGRSRAMKESSWDALSKLIADCAIDTGVSDFASSHDRYLYGSRLSERD